MPLGQSSQNATVALPAMSRPSPGLMVLLMLSSWIGERFRIVESVARSRSDCYMRARKPDVRTRFCAVSWRSRRSTVWVMPVGMRPQERPSDQNLSK